MTPPVGRVPALRYIHGRTTREAAAELGITREAVRDGERRAVPRLAKALPGLVG